MYDWPHAPPHRFDSTGSYFVTGATYLNRHYFRRADDLSFAMRTLLTLAIDYSVNLQSWSLFSNHYHLVANGAGSRLKAMLARLHGDLARYANRRDGVEERKVWFQCRDTALTFQRSWLARLKYPHYNPVRHGLVAVASNYPWCSAGWFERTASPAFVRVIENLGISRVHVQDDFDVIAPED